MCIIHETFVDTEIDWDTYMKQVKIYIEAERDYTKISGPTGPLVYASHLRVSLLRLLTGMLDTQLGMYTYMNGFTRSQILAEICLSPSNYTACCILCRRA